MIRRARELCPIIGVFLAGNRAMLFAGAFLATVTTLSGIALLGLSGWFITATGIAGLSAVTALGFDVFAPSAGIRFLALARTAGRYGERLATHDATLGVLAELRERLFRGWAGPGMVGALTKRPSQILFRLTLDIDALDSLYLRVAVPFAGALIVAAVSGFVLAQLHPALGAVTAILLVAVGTGVAIAAATVAMKPARRKAIGLEIVRSRVIDLIAGQTEWIMAGQITDRLGGLAAADRYLSDSDDALDRVETNAGIAFGIASALLLSGVLAAGALLVQHGLVGAPAAAFGLLVALAALDPFAALRRGAVELGRTLIAVRRIGPRLETTAPVADTVCPSPGIAVRLADVIVRHAGASAPTLHRASLSIADGERVAVIGPSGAGKSTLLSLIGGEIDAETGHVAHRSTTLFTQRTELFQDMVRDNLRLANPKADDNRLWEVLEAAGLRDTFETMPDGLDTRLGEGGHGLSGGQGRRLALARLFLRDTPLWLLDEPTEGLDGATARDVLARLAAQAEGRTIVVATHIRREAEAADRLIIMDKGTVVAIIGRGESGFGAMLARLRPD